MTLTENKTNTQAVAAKRQELKPSELNQVSGAKQSCCTTWSYKTGNYRKTRVAFVTVVEREYFCSMCEQRHWKIEFEYFE